MLNAIKNPEQTFNSMMQSNPAFRKFCMDNRMKTPQQIAAEHGIPFDLVKSLMQGGAK